MLGFVLGLLGKLLGLFGFLLRLIGLLAHFGHFLLVFLELLLVGCLRPGILFGDPGVFRGDLLRLLGLILGLQLRKLRRSVRGPFRGRCREERFSLLTVRRHPKP